MFLWFLGLSFALVLVVFDSAALDYRLIMLGSVLPWIDFLWGGPWLMHSVFFPVLVMCLVMIVGWGRRLRQRRWLGLAIGLFLHLILAATWTRQELFWWPGFGFDTGERPVVASPAVGAVLELIGAATLVQLYRLLGLADSSRRDLFVRTGHIDRELLRG